MDIQNRVQSSFVLKISEYINAGAAANVHNPYSQHSYSNRSLKKKAVNVQRHCSHFQRPLSRRELEKK